ncbi:MAG: BamA/TamA family outer membrane protein [Paludibacteraceae bacterium]|nr:BamA/TamA family outer membrane protein [Paludibacteraceae bacterium]
MRGHGIYIWIVLVPALVLASCNTTKFVPQGQYLLNKARIRCVDDKSVPTGDLRSYLRQTQNTEIFGFWKLQLDVYNTAPSDTTSATSKKLARNAHKMGEAPVIYDDELTKTSMQQLEQQMNNMGYFNAKVDTQKIYKRRKVEVNYIITANKPYIIRSYGVDMPVDALYEVAADPQRCLVLPGDKFNTSTMDEERQRITSVMRNRGYFYFEKSMLEFTADSALGTHEVDIRLHLAPYVYHLDSATLARVRTRYRIRHVEYKLDKPFLRKDVLRRACRLKEGEQYADWRVERTYARMNAMAPVKYVDIAFTDAGDSLLDCSITVSRGRLNSVAAEVEGTYSAGDWGVAAGLNYSNKNIFHGAEVLTLGGRASYEWRANGGRAIEAKAEAGLLFPSNVKLNVAYNYQQRPEEYTRTIVNAGLSYTIPRQPGSRWTHQFNLIDINYIYLPWMSEQFKKDFMDKSSVLKASYEDHFILDWSYTGTYSTYSQRFPNRSFLQLALRVETAGNALYALSTAARFEKNNDGHYVLWKIPFAQYAKGDVNFTYHGIITPEHHLVGHVGIGVAVPYLNADAVPFQKRYFAGGANGIRGWQARTLGPGTFRGIGNAMVYDLQAGDVKLDANIEYRFKVLKFLELAAFMDAGNIWTIREYDSQPGGAFTADFYKQIAWSYGVGVRFDLSLLIFRIDFGVKLHDPSRIAEGKQWRTAANGLGWKDDMTFHFAIGHPF